MTTTTERARVIADLLRSAIHVGLPLPSVRDYTDHLRLVFDDPADLRTWAEWFHVKTVTVQAAESPRVVVEFFDAEADGVPVRALSSTAPILRLVAS